MSNAQMVSNRECELISICTCDTGLNHIAKCQDPGTPVAQVFTLTLATESFFICTVAEAKKVKKTNYFADNEGKYARLAI
jgi:hypothetical protein